MTMMTPCCCLRSRFLFRQRLTHQRMRKFLSVMMKLKKAKNLDPRLEALVDNAFYTCCPPERYSVYVAVVVVVLTLASRKV